MSAPFLLAKSDNMLQAQFTESFHHARHYRCLINGVLTVAENQFKGHPWAIMINWGGSFIQIPEEEKLCMQFLHEYYKAGLKYLVNVTPSHPIVEWQMQKISKANPQVEIFTTDSVEAGEQWLQQRNINIETDKAEISEDWYKKTKAFSGMVEKYGIDKQKFDSP